MQVFVDFYEGGHSVDAISRFQLLHALHVDASAEDESISISIGTSNEKFEHAIQLLFVMLLYSHWETKVFFYILQYHKSNSPQKKAFEFFFSTIVII